MVRYIDTEVACVGPHCGDTDCECPTLEVEIPMDSAAMDRLWREHGPEGERHYARAWENTDVQPWRAIGAMVIRAESRATSVYFT